MPPNPAPTTPARTGGGLTRRIGGIPLYVYLGAGAAIVGGILYVRHKNSQEAAAAAAAGAGAAGQTGGTQATPTAGYAGAGGGGSDGGIGADTLAAILSSQGEGSNASSAGALSGLLQGQVLAPNKQGYTDPSGSPISDSAGNTYVPTASGYAAQQQYNAGVTLYQEVAPNIFQPVQRGASANNAVSQGQTYVRIPSSNAAGGALTTTA